MKQYTLIISDSVQDNNSKFNHININPNLTNKELIDKIDFLKLLKTATISLTNFNIATLTVNMEQALVTLNLYDVDKSKINTYCLINPVMEIPINRLKHQYLMSFDTISFRMGEKYLNKLINLK